MPDDFDKLIAGVHGTKGQPSQWVEAMAGVMAASAVEGGAGVSGYKSIFAERLDRLRYLRPRSKDLFVQVIDRSAQAVLTLQGSKQPADQARRLGPKALLEVADTLSVGLHYINYHGAPSGVPDYRVYHGAPAIEKIKEKIGPIYVLALEGFQADVKTAATPTQSLDALVAFQNAEERIRVPDGHPYKWQNRGFVANSMLEDPMISPSVALNFLALHPAQTVNVTNRNWVRLEDRISGMPDDHPELGKTGEQGMKVAKAITQHRYEVERGSAARWNSGEYTWRSCNPLVRDGGSPMTRGDIDLNRKLLDIELSVSAFSEQALGRASKKTVRIAQPTANPK